MTPKQISFRKSLLAKIHQLPSVRMLKENDDWKEWLGVRYGVDSSGLLSIEELGNVVAVLIRGEEAKQSRRGRPPAKIAGQARNDGNGACNDGVCDTQERATEKQLNAIEALWRENARNPTDAALREFINLVVKVRPLHLEMLTKEQATKIITGIKRL